MEAQEVNGQPKKYSCGHEKCGYQTNKLFNFQRHRKIHEKKAQLREIVNNHSNLTRSPPSAIDAPAAKIQRLDIECADSTCTYRGDQLEDYVDHVHSCHEKELKFVDKKFDDRESLEDFLRKLQEKSSCSMILSRSLDGTPPESFELCCSASGRYRRRSDQRGLLQSSGDIRSGIYCTFYLSVNVFDNAIYVKGCQSHFGHQIETLIPSPPRMHTHTQASSTSGDESLNAEENQNICPMEDDAKSEQLVIVEEQEQIVVDDNEDKRTPDFQRELQRIALDIQTETELFTECEATLSSIEFEQLKVASSTIVEILRACRGRPALTQLNTENGQSSPPTQTTRFNSTGSIIPTGQLNAQRHSTASLPTSRQLGASSKPATPAATQISQLHQQFLQQSLQQPNANTLSQLSSQLPQLSLTNGLPPQAALLLAATAQQQRAMCNANTAQQPALQTNNVLAVLATLNQQQQLAQNQQSYIPPTTTALSLLNNNNNSIATTLQQLAQLNATNNASPKFDDVLRKAIVEFERRSAWTTAVQR